MITKEIKDKLSDYIKANYIKFSFKSCSCLFDKPIFKPVSHHEKNEEKLDDTSESCIGIDYDKSINFDLLFKVKPKFSTVLFKFIDEKKMTDVECYKKAGIDRRLFSKIRSDEYYQPAKKTVFCFILSLELDLDKSKELLSSAGYSLSRSYLTDVIIEYCIENKIYNIFDVNELLVSYNEAPIAFN